MRRVYRFLIFVLIGVTFTLVLSPQKIAAAFTVSEQPVSTVTSWKAFPKIYGDLIIFWDFWRNGGDPDACYIHNLASGTEAIFSETNCAFFVPEIYAHILTWEQNDGNWNIYMYNLDTSTKTQITDEAAEQSIPAIDDNKIVWEDSRNGTKDIYLYNIDTAVETRITNSAGIERFPRIYQEKIVWQDNRNGNQDIYLYDLETLSETRLTTNGSNQMSPDIFGDKVVWEDYRNGANPDIYLYDLTTHTESQITTDAGIQQFPKIYGNKIVWSDKRNYPATLDYDVYLYDLDSNTETRITPSGNRQAGVPEIWENRIVWDDTRNYPAHDGADIFMATLSSPGDSSPILFQNLPDSSLPVNLQENQMINTPEYDLQIKPYSKAGIEKVEFFVDNNLLCTDTSPDSNGIYSCIWDTTKYHSVVKIVAYDKNGHQNVISRNVQVLSLKILPIVGGGEEDLMINLKNGLLKLLGGENGSERF